MIPSRNPNDEMGVFEQLKPLYGASIDQLWYAYLASNPQRKAAILQRLQLLAAQVQQKRIGDRKIYLEPPKPEVIDGGDYAIGKVLFPGKAPYEFTLHRKELLRHVFLCGPAGSGKTTLIINLLEQLQEDNIPWLALDWKRSFRVMTLGSHGKEVRVFTVGSDAAPLRLNVLLPPPGVSTAAFVDNLTETICNGYSLLEGAQSTVKAVLFDAIKQYGNRATLRDALQLLQQRFSDTPQWRRRQIGWMESTERAFVQLTTGSFGNCINEREHPTLIGDLLTQQVVIELEGIGQAQGSTLSIFFLQCTLLTRQKQTGEREILRHATFIDEAQNVFRREATWEKLSLPSRVIREVREYGECVIAATQQTDVADSLLANTGTKLVMRTNSKWELDYFSKIFQIDPAILTMIPNGQGIAVIPSRYYKPFHFSFPENKRKNVEVSDEEVRAQYESWRGGTPSATPVVLPPERLRIGPKEHALLRSIATNQTTPITQHYDLLGWNHKIGNEVKNTLLRHGIITLNEVRNGRALMKIPAFTKDGMKLLGEQGIPSTPPVLGLGGTEHEYWRDQLRILCETKGYTVTPEYEVSDQRYVDLRAERGKLVFLIEVETGKSDIARNIEKCAGKGLLVMFFTNTKAREDAEPIPLHIITITPDTITTLNDLLE